MYEDDGEVEDEIVAGPCPRCGTLDPIPIIYGLPIPEVFDAADRGEVVLGGCTIIDGAPTHVCRACGGRY